MDTLAEWKHKSRFCFRATGPKVLALLFGVCTLFLNGSVYGLSIEATDTCTGITVGDTHTCTLTAEGNVYCYGNNVYGQAEGYFNGDAIAVSAGAIHTCILKNNGNVNCYGYYNQVRDYTGGDAVCVSAGGYHSCVLNSEGNVNCYGDNAYGQAADYEIGDAIDVSAGLYHTCILKNDGNVDCYGSNRYRQAEDYTGGDAVGVSAGGYHTCVLKADSNVYCYGNGWFRQTASYNGGDAKGVSAGHFHTCILKTNGNTDCYGYSRYEQAGDYTNEDAVGVAAAYNHTCVLTSNGYLNCYGLNKYGQAESYYVGDAVCKTGSENQAPIFDQIEPLSVQEYDYVDVILSATDPDGDNFNYSCEGLPVGADFDEMNGVFSWIPSYDQAGTYLITFLATDDGTPSKTAQLDVLITVNDISPSELVDIIIFTIQNDLDLPKNALQSYLATLKKVNGFIDRGMVMPAINQLKAFMKKVGKNINQGEVGVDEGVVAINMSRDVINKLQKIILPRTKKGNQKKKS